MRWLLLLLLSISALAQQSLPPAPSKSREHDLFLVTATFTIAAAGLDAGTTAVCGVELNHPELYSAHPENHVARVILVKSAITTGAIGASWVLRRAKLPRIIWLTPMLWLGVDSVSAGVQNLSPRVRGWRPCL